MAAGPQRNRHESRGVNKRQRALIDLRWHCDLAIGAARLQRTRIMEHDQDDTRHDLDFYALAVWRLQELARQAKTRNVAGAADIHAAILTRWPLLGGVRNWWTHARSVEWTSWFSDVIYRLEPGSATSVISARYDHDDVETFYVRLCKVLGPLPTA